MKYGERVPAGDDTEAKVARMLSSKGHKVIKPPRRDGPWDLMVDGRSIDVKGGVRTISRGSDGNPIKGYVFSNMHPSPKVEFYLLACLSKSRSINTYYLIPSSMAKQQTLTLTDTKASELAPYRENLSPLMRKKAMLIKRARRPYYADSPDRAFERHLHIIEQQNSYDMKLVDAGGRIGGAIMLGSSDRLYRHLKGERMSTRASAMALLGISAGRMTGQFISQQGR